MLKVCLIGVGGISGAHIPAWLGMEDVTLAGICDIRPEQMEQYPDLHHYADMDEMLEAEKPDILDICLPTFLHVEYAMRAMEKGINVLCEKPVSLHEEDAEKLYACAEKNGVKFMVAHVLRWWDEYEYIKELIDTKKYGKLLSGEMHRLSPIPGWSWDGWMQDEKRSGFVPFDLHIHDLDFLVYALGEPTAVHSHRSKRPEQDYFCVTYEFGDAFVTAEASWYAAPIPFDAGFRFQFEKAVVISGGGKFMVYSVDEGAIDRTPGAENETGGIDLPATNAYANEIRYFAACVKENRPADKVRPQELKAVCHILNNL
ncbi:MAG: Gfo/Idh/MocA family oxidoreductase [Clostridia bacterium]|nr:Gfo/Idh/MocA family oxidoreductase [Clostridia bacterium]